MDDRDPSNLRGDPITGDRYFSPEFAQKEWNHLWARIWRVARQEMELAEGQLTGMHSRSYGDAYLSAQETRVRFFHEVINDYIEGRR
jgi:hypothetical protein